MQFFPVVLSLLIGVCMLKEILFCLARFNSADASLKPTMWHYNVVTEEVQGAKYYSANLRE